MHPEYKDISSMDFTIDRGCTILVYSGLSPLYVWREARQVER